MEDFVSAPWLRRLITVVLLAGLVLLGFRIIEPFIVPLVWAGILGYVSWPAYEWLVRKLQGRSTLAAVLMTIAVSAGGGGADRLARGGACASNWCMAITTCARCSAAACSCRRRC